MPKYVVRATTMAYMTGRREVEASSPEEAQEIVEESWGDTLWEYDGIAEGPWQGPEVQSVERLPPFRYVVEYSEKNRCWSVRDTTDGTKFPTLHPSEGAAHEAAQERNHD
jgi:hypothetical protein